MGIINVTPDSFSDGGLYTDPGKAIAHGLRLRSEGAAILDVGGESTRPGAKAVSVEEETARVVPVIKGLRDCGAVISVDTRNVATMRAAIEAGASMVNDITALTHNAESMDVVASNDVSVCLMHMQGEPQTMQESPRYDDVFAEVYAYLEQRVDACEKAGMKRERIMIDPGIGFGKGLNHNLILLNQIGDFKAMRLPVLLGASRKSFISRIVPDTAEVKRLPGSLAACIAGFERGIRHFRVHDVAETVQALAVYRSIQTS